MAVSIHFFPLNFRLRSFSVFSPEGFYKYNLRGGKEKKGTLTVLNKVGAFSFFTIQFIIQGKRKIPLFYDMKFELQVFVLSQATPPVPFPNSCCLRVDRKDRRTVCADIRNFPRDSDASLPLFAVRHLPRKMFQPPHPGLYGDIGGRICGGGRVRKSAARELVNANRG